MAIKITKARHKKNVEKVKKELEELEKNPHLVLFQSAPSTTVITGIENIFIKGKKIALPNPYKIIISVRFLSNLIIEESVLIIVLKYLFVGDQT